MLNRRARRAALLPLLLLVSVAGCGAEIDTSNTAEPPRAGAAATASVATMAAESVPGHIAFRTSGTSRRFDHLPADRNTFSRYGSTVTARPSESATETLAITFLSIDLSALEYPATLPPPKDISKPMSASLAMAGVGFSYIDDAGNEWAGPGTLQLASFEDGRLTGSFDNAVVPHTEGTLPDIELNDGAFSVQLR